MRDHPEELDNDCWKEGLPANIIADIIGEQYQGSIDKGKKLLLRYTTLHSTISMESSEEKTASLT